MKAIEECEGLETLNLSGKSFGVEASEAVGEALRNKPTLKHAQWSDMFVTKLKTEIPQSLVSPPFMLYGVCVCVHVCVYMYVSMCSGSDGDDLTVCSVYRRPWEEGSCSLELNWLSWT